MFMLVVLPCFDLGLTVYMDITVHSSAIEQSCPVYLYRYPVVCQRINVFQVSISAGKTVSAPEV